MRKIIWNSIVLTILIVSLVIIISYNGQHGIDTPIKVLIYIIVGVLLVAIALMIGSTHDKDKPKPPDNTQLNAVDKKDMVNHDSNSGGRP